MSELKFGKKEMKQVIEGYYKKYEDFDGTFTSACSLQLVGCGMMEREDAVVSMKINGVLNVCGMEIEMSRDISEDDLVNVFSVVLGDIGYTVDNVVLDKGTTEVCEGYYMNERMVSKPYFKGASVKVREKSLVR